MKGSTTALITAKTKPVSERPVAIIREDLHVSSMLKNHTLARNLKCLYTASSAELNACGENVRPDVLALTAVSSKQEPSAT